MLATKDCLPAGRQESTSLPKSASTGLAWMHVVNSCM